MIKHSFHIMASAALILAATALPIHAEGLGGTIGGALGGLGNGVGNTVSGAANGVTGSVTSSIGKTKATVGAVTSKGVLSADAKSNILSGIKAKARVLSPEELAKLCVSTGGGTGCGSGNRPRILGLIDARVVVLSNKRLLSVCASAGSGCGGNSIVSIGANPENDGTGGGTAPGNGVPGSQTVANMSDKEVVTYKKRCANILGSPQKYESDIVSICRLIKQQ